MTVYRCNQCGTVAETTQAHNTTAVCAKCKNSVQVYDTVFYIQWLLKQYFAVSAELKTLKENNQTLDEIDRVIENKTAQKTNLPKENNIAQSSKQPQLPNDIIKKIKDIFQDNHRIKLGSLSAEIKKVIPDFDQTQYGFKKKFSDFIRQCDFLEIKGENQNMTVLLKQNKNNQSQKSDKKTVQAALNNTDLFATEQQHADIKKYLNDKNIAAIFDYAAVDMSGYFDEAAELIGDNFKLLEKYLKQIRYLYANNKIGLTIDCVSFSAQDTQKLQKIFQQLFDYTVIAKYIYQNNDKKMRISLNAAEPVKKFFMGGWLEWYATIKLLKETHKQGKKFSIARSLVVQLDNGDKHEFDVVFKPENQIPIFIECKSGEFRQNLDKFIKICKKINIPTQNWLVLACEIDKTQANAFEKMYPVRFCDLSHFVEKVKPLI